MRRKNPKIIQTALPALLTLLLPLAANAKADSLEGNYRLDFYASSGSCANESLIRIVNGAVVFKSQPTEWGNHFRIGAHCRDRSFGPKKPPENCSTYVETNLLSPDGQQFTNIITGPAEIDGRVSRKLVSKFSVQLLPHGRLQADRVTFDREGAVEAPVSRCVYDRTSAG